MKTKIIHLFFAAMLLSGCRYSFADNEMTVRLTPYNTKTPEMPEKDKSPTVIESPVPVPTPDNIEHVVTIGETISSIALKYGLPIDTILLANPEISPTALIVGDEVIIPSGDDFNPISTDPMLVERIQFHSLNCQNSGGGFWCSVLMKNTLERGLRFPVVTFKVLNASGEKIQDYHIPCTLNQIDAGADIPCMLQVPEALEGSSAVEVALFSIEEKPEGEAIFDVLIESEENAFFGMSASISGRMRVEGESTENRANITVVATAYDAVGKIVGVRRLDSTVVTGESFDYTIPVYSVGADIVSLRLFVEAY